MDLFFPTFPDDGIGNLNSKCPDHFQKKVLGLKQKLTLPVDWLDKKDSNHKERQSQP